MQFFREFLQTALLAGSSIKENEKIDLFEACLEYGSPADEWFAGLSSEQKSTIRSLTVAFRERWPPNDIPKPDRDEYIRELKGWKLDVDDLLKKVDSGGREVYGHVRWANGLVPRAENTGDTTCMLLSDVYTALPEPVRDLIRSKPRTSYKELASAVRDIPVSDLQETVQKYKKDEETARLAREPPASPTKALRTALNATHLQPPGAVPRAYPVQSRAFPAPAGNPFASIGGGRGTLFPPRNTSPSPAAVGGGQRARQGLLTRPEIRDRAIADRYRDLRANTKAPDPDTEQGKSAYRAQMAAYLRSNAGYEPDEQHPHPLSPGSAPIGSRECFRCGHGGHRSTDCNGIPMPVQEQRWRAIAAYIERQYTAERNAAVNFVGQQYDGYEQYGGWDANYEASSYPGEVDDVPGNGAGPSA
ncbi:hypothetical protein PLICRDRAFT_52453 [Plicaturopsis crispa FD-325 SS-3]|nr:hypothetical protein PLICRDRAFT_52453 [Plicaturopsis crispa FD-325 SS-3]